MLNVTDHSCISPATSKGGFSYHPGDLSRKCHLCHGACKSQKRGARPPSYRLYSISFNLPYDADFFWSYILKDCV